MAIRKLFTLISQPNDVPTDLASLPVLRDPDHTFGLKETVSGTVIIPPYDGTNAAATQFVRDGLGQYHIIFDKPPAGKSYTCSIEWVRAGETEPRYDLSTFTDDPLDGPGADKCTLVIEDGSPVADAEVWITADADGHDVVAGSKRTDSDGEVVFLLDAGVASGTGTAETYYLWMRKDGENPILGRAFQPEAD